MMAHDNYIGDMDFIGKKDVEKLKKLHDEAIKNRRGWINYENKRLSTNFVHYVVTYLSKDKKDE